VDEKGLINANGVEQGRSAALAYLSAPDRLMTLSGRCDGPNAGNLCTVTRGALVSVNCVSKSDGGRLGFVQGCHGPLIRQPLGMECNGSGIFLLRMRVTLQAFEFIYIVSLCKERA
jgi:hypothetical protein